MKWKQLFTNARNIFFKDAGDILYPITSHEQLEAFLDGALEGMRIRLCDALKIKK